MTDKSVTTEDPDVTSCGIAHEQKSEEPEPDGNYDVASLTYRTEKGRTINIRRGDQLIDGMGMAVGTIDRVHHAPTSEDVAWRWTVYIDYTSEDLNDAEPGGLPLGEFAEQTKRGVLDTAR